MSVRVLSKRAQLVNLRLCPPASAFMAIGPHRPPFPLFVPPRRRWGAGHRPTCDEGRWSGSAEQVMSCQTALEQQAQAATGTQFRRYRKTPIMMRRLWCWIFHGRYRTKYNRFVGYYLKCSKCGDTWE